MTLPAVLSSQLPELTEARPTNVEPWIETLLFGNVSDVSKLLDGGLDPNAATTPGGTTALMMVAPDVEKMHVLIEHGANVNARSPRGVTPLMVAARYQDSDAAIAFLVSKGARGDGRSRVSALANAANAGNARVIRALHEARDDVTAQALDGAIRNGDIEVARALLDLGADVNAAPGLGAVEWSLIERAVFNNDLELARLFIGRGADVNHVDSEGYTPLLLAASIDFGDSEMIDLLLKSGARVDVRNKAGETPLDLARKYKHVALIRRLEQQSRTN